LMGEGIFAELQIKKAESLAKLEEAKLKLEALKIKAEHSTEKRKAAYQDDTARQKIEAQMRQDNLESKARMNRAANLEREKQVERRRADRATAPRQPSFADRTRSVKTTLTDLSAEFGRGFSDAIKPKPRYGRSGSKKHN
jgi:hypothetical protein